MATNIVNAVRSPRVSSLRMPSPSGSVPVPKRSVDCIPKCWLRDVFVISRSEMDVADASQGLTTNVGFSAALLEARLCGGRPSTARVFQRPSLNRDKRPKQMPVDSSGVDWPGRSESRVRCRSAVT